jgi:hypothetical protein
VLADFENSEQGWSRRELGRLEAKIGPDFRGGQEKELIPDVNEELFKESPSHSSSLLQGNVPLRKALPLPSVVGLCPQAVTSAMSAWPLRSMVLFLPSATLHREGKKSTLSTRTRVIQVSLDDTQLQSRQKGRPWRDQNGQGGAG